MERGEERGRFLGDEKEDPSGEGDERKMVRAAEVDRRAEFKRPQKAGVFAACLL